MTEFGGPPGGRHSSGFPESSFPAGQDVRGNLPGLPARGFAAPPLRAGPLRAAVVDHRHRRPPVDAVARTTGSLGHASGLLDRHPDETGPLVEPEWWAYATSDHPGHPMTARHSGEEPLAGRRPGFRPARRPGIAPPVGAAAAHALGRLGPPALPPRRTAGRRGDRGPAARPPGPAGGRRAGCPPQPGRRARGRRHRGPPRRPPRLGGPDGRSRRHRGPRRGRAARRLGRRARREAPAAEAARRARPDAGEDLDEADAHDLEHDVLDSDGHDPDGLVHDEDFGSTSRSSPTTRAPPAPGGAEAGRRPRLPADAGRPHRRHRPGRAEAAHADRPVLA